MEVHYLVIEYRKGLDTEVLVYTTAALRDQACREIGEELADEYGLESLSDEALEHGDEAWLYEASEHGQIYFSTGSTTLHDGTPKD